MKWRTREGVELDIATEMEPLHAANCARMMRRMIPQFLDQEIDDAWQFLGTLNGDMAQFEMERVIAQLMDLRVNASTEDLIAWLGCNPTYQALVERAGRYLTDRNKPTGGAVHDW